MSIRIGSRDSKLATWQATWVAQQLANLGVETNIVFMKTLGDVKSGPIGNVGTQGVFTKEIQRALLDDEVDLAVHSLKDLPTEDIDGLRLAAVPTRERCGDALLAREVRSIDALPLRAKVATGSARRKAQLLAYRSDLDVVELRGNVDTRLRKLHDDGLDAIILAEAGLHRLELHEHITQVIPKEIMLPAVGQGALGLEIRAGDNATFDVLQSLNDPATHAAVLAERAMLRRLRGGCLAPVGAWARTDAKNEHDLVLDGVVLSPDGSERQLVRLEGSIDAPEQLGHDVANELLACGAERILNESR